MIVTQFITNFHESTQIGLYLQICMNQNFDHALEIK